VLAGPLSVVALIAGWVVTEVGRQPWVVYRVMPTDAAVTGANGIPVGYAALALVRSVVNPVSLEGVGGTAANCCGDGRAQPSRGGLGRGRAG
jgi:hypothetical protein